MGNQQQLACCAGTRGGKDSSLIMGELEKTLNEQISRRRPRRKNNLQNMTLDNEDILKLLENEETAP